MSAVPTTAGPLTRSGALGAALGASVTGLLQALGTVGILVMLSRSLDGASWGWPRLAMSASLLVFGIAGALAWASARAGRLATAVAVMAAVGVAGSAVWLAKPLVEFGPWGDAMREIVLGLALAMVVAAAGWTWSRTADEPVRVAGVALGAVIGMAAVRLSDLVATAMILDDVSPGEQRTSLMIGVAGGVLLTVAALLAVVALAGRLPAVAVASVVAIAAVLLVVVVVRDASSMDVVIVSANDRSQVSVLMSLASGAGQALVALALACVLVVAGRAASRSGYGAGTAATREPTPTP